MRVTIRPSTAQGVITAPPSKSMAHRLLICAGLAEGESIVRNLAYSEDIKATIACLRSLGAEIRLDGDTAYIKGTDVTKSTGIPAVLPCNESGSTLRFFIPLCLLNGDEHVLTGSEYLMTRPLSVYKKIAQEQGLRFGIYSDRVITTGKLSSGVYDVPGSVSSQFISGLMFALPLMERSSQICVTPPVESLPYIDMTVSALKTFGVEAEHGFHQTDNCFFWLIPAGKYIPADVTVEGDWSNAAFFEALNYMGSDIEVTGLDPDSIQGDKACIILYKKIKSSDEVIDISDCPDLGPILFAVVAMCGGAKFTGTRRLKLKESDRAASMQEELKKFGVEMTIGENDVIVHAGTPHAPNEALSGHNDHRIVMALAVLATVTGGVIDGAEAVSKSFPDFFDRLKELGVDLEYGMDQ